ncbi:hypothetical protein K458DRAFT_374926 [Lentithecium fluviatile CBS 122367]|uniref:RBR-type E3 ubiquitin transferase n=1 Tax=Lentithecium fluviatile CBS 122367 TaxID=1168545 RepID=A0A6G1IMF1_9PLEO|nr:hypothetical protein K458DRAFT_374926 [Lentithecium fluviatile CBS 122367]
MAPVTRLRRKLDRRISDAYAQGSRRNPIVLGEEESDMPAQPSTHDAPQQNLQPAQTPQLSILGAWNSKNRPAAKVHRLKNDGNRVAKKTSVKKARKIPETMECAICVETKQVKRSFTKLETGGCTHFNDTCNRCVGKMIKTNIAERKLDGATLACPFPDCESVLGYAEVEQFLSPAQFERWDSALTRHVITSNEEFIACLSFGCGKYFSKAACKPKRANNRHRIECPYCDYAMCLTCNRPWHNKSCNEEKKAEEKKSEETIKSMGAKPCPKCSVAIQKNGGCDHMTCKRCRHDFCWLCLVAFKPGMVHAEGCKAGQGIALDPRNWVAHMGFDAGNIEAMVNAVDNFFGARQQPAPDANQGVRPQQQAGAGGFGAMVQWFTGAGARDPRDERVQ